MAQRPFRSALLLALPVVCTTLRAQDVRENPLEDPPDLPAPTTSFAPGADMCLGLTWEPTIAVDPNDPTVVAAAQFTTVRVSIDGGNTFPPALTLTATVPGPFGIDPGWCAGGDPSLAFDSQGRLFLTYLGTRCLSGESCNPTGGGPACSAGSGGRDVFLTGWQRAGNQFVQFVGPVNVTALAGHGAPHNADKEWLAADWHAGGVDTDNLYVVWSDIDQEPWQVWTAFSTDSGLTWSAAQQLSVATEGRRVWPSHNTVAPNHDVYVAYHAQKGFLDGAPDYDVPDGVSGRVIVHRSTDGGMNYTKTATNPFDADDATFSEADMTWNVQHKPNGVIPNASYWLVGSVQPWILADPYVNGRLYVVCNDDPDDDVDVGDAADVMIVRSDDFGATWTAPTQVDDAPGTNFTVLPTAAIDPVSGAIGVSWYDPRLGALGTSGDRLLDLRATYSADGGLNWFPSIDVSDGTFDPGLSTNCRFCCTAGACPAGSPQTLRIGEYNGVAYGQCALHFVWADDATCGGGFADIYYDRDEELGGDLTPPVITCPANTQVGCNDPTGPNATGFATAVDDCTLAPEISYVDVILPGNCPPSVVLHSIQRIWSAVDLAGNLNTCDQIISVVDFDAPVINVPPPLVLQTTQGCLPSSTPAIQNWAAQATAVDACSGATLSYNLPAVFPADCGGRTTDVVFSAADDCGNGDFAIGHVTLVVVPGAGVSFCYGDGSGTACPCGNVGLLGHGCDISQATGGVCLTAQDFAPDGLGGGTVRLLGTNFPLGSAPSVKLIRSQNFANGQAGVVFGDGKLCLGGPITRLGTMAAQDGKVEYVIAHNAGMGRFHYQLWLRNLPVGFCDPAAGYNLSNAVTLDW